MAQGVFPSEVVWLHRPTDSPITDEEALSVILSSILLYLRQSYSVRSNTKLDHDLDMGNYSKHSAVRTQLEAAFYSHTH